MSSKGLENLLNKTETPSDTPDAIQQEQEEAKKMETLGRTFVGFVHDINNLISPPILGAQMLQRAFRKMSDEYGIPEEKAQRAQDQLQIIYEACNKTDELLKEALRFMKNPEYHISHINLQELISETIRTVVVPEEYNIHMDTSTTVAQADPIHFPRVIQNLLKNSIEAMQYVHQSDGKLTIKTDIVTVEEGSWKTFNVPGGEYVRITVSDNGPGMDQETLDTFSTPKLKTKEGGSGFGLINVYNIVKSHGGFLDVATQKGEGTTFSIYLPGRTSVLLVEDEEVTRSAARKLLEDEGFITYVAENGEEGLQLYKDHKPNLVMTDNHMPKMSGVSLIESILEIDHSAPILVCSGESQEDPRPNMYRVEKPIKDIELLSKVHEASAYIP